ncbi:MAG: energy transducer TonB [Xanthomonadales bacterium]|jgi:protein TonB|nr:energy transducer TonB [Xanthomonadales bacterium]
MTATVAQTLVIPRFGSICRVITGILFGLVMTAALFWAMPFLIETTDRQLDTTGSAKLVDFVRLRRDEIIHRRELKPRKPLPPQSPPPLPATPQFESLSPSAGTIAVSAAPVETDIEISDTGFSLGVGEGDYLPIVKVAPIYPQRALSRGIEGYCVVQYTVTRQGTIRDPFVIEDQCTSSMFHRSSLQAALKFKYKPRVIDGQAVEVTGVQNKFTYIIEE